MKRKGIVAGMICLALAFALSGCSSSNTEKRKNHKSEEVTTGSEDVKAVSTQELTQDEQIYQNLFDIENSVTVKIDISKEELDKIQDDYEKNNDVPY